MLHLLPDDLGVWCPCTSAEDFTGSTEHHSATLCDGENSSLTQPVGPRTVPSGHLIHLGKGNPSRWPATSRPSGSSLLPICHADLGHVVSKSRANSQGPKEPRVEATAPGGLRRTAQRLTGRENSFPLNRDICLGINKATASARSQHTHDVRPSLVHGATLELLGHPTSRLSLRKNKSQTLMIIHLPLQTLWSCKEGCS